MNRRDNHQASRPLWWARQWDPPLLCHLEGRSEYRLAGSRSQAHEHVGVEHVQLGRQPRLARANLGLARRLMDPTLSTLCASELEVLHGIRHIGLASAMPASSSALSKIRSAGPTKGRPSGPPGRPAALRQIPPARWVALPEHRLRGRPVELTASTSLDRLASRSSPAPAGTNGSAPSTDGRVIPCPFPSCQTSNHLAPIPHAAAPNARVSTSARRRSGRCVVLPPCWPCQRPAL